MVSVEGYYVEWETFEAFILCEPEDFLKIDSSDTVKELCSKFQKATIEVEELSNKKIKYKIKGDGFEKVGVYGEEGKKFYIVRKEK